MLFRSEVINELDKIPAIELNISCPNVKQGGMAFGVTAKGAEEVVKAVRAAYKKDTYRKAVSQRDQHR